MRPELGLDDPDLPKYWFDGDVFKTRFFDAMSLLFPEGERFFIACVRDFRDQIADPELQSSVCDFIYQEGQHGIAHARFNQRIKAQGIAVDHIERETHRYLFSVYRKYCSRRYTLALTAASEHLTAVMAHGFFEKGLLGPADARMRALYAWHAVEEIEHKEVAFNVYRDVAKGGYLIRMLGMLQVSLTFPLHTFLIMQHMFKVDGRQKKTQRWLRGRWWLYGRKGVFSGLWSHYLAYYRPGFHPRQQGHLKSYLDWRATYEEAGNAIAAGDSLRQASDQIVS